MVKTAFIPLCSFHRADQAVNRKQTKTPVYPETCENTGEATLTPRGGTARLNKRAINLLDPAENNRAESKPFRRTRSESSPPTRAQETQDKARRAEPAPRAKSTSPAPLSPRLDNEWLTSRFHAYLLAVTNGGTQEDALRAVSTEEHPPTDLGLLFYENLGTLAPTIPRTLSGTALSAVQDLQKGDPDWPVDWTEDIKDAHKDSSRHTPALSKNAQITHDLFASHEPKPGEKLSDSPGEPLRFPGSDSKT